MPRELPQRRTIRMRGYDYANEGAYYLTICTHERAHLFGRIADGVMVPNAMGELAQRCWNAIPDHMPHVDVGEFVVMPNHVHGIVVIRERAVDVRGVGARHDAPVLQISMVVPMGGKSSSSPALLKAAFAFSVSMVMGGKVL